MNKKVIIAFILLLLFNVITVYAGTSLYGYYHDYDKVKVMVNGKELDSNVPAFIIDSTTVIPLRAVVESLDTIVKWDDEKKVAEIVKPNVNMQFTANPYKDKDAYVIYSPFGKIPSNRRYNFTFYVYSEVDNLPHENVQVKLVLKQPDGTIMQETDVQSFDASVENSLLYFDHFDDITFYDLGNYSVDFLLKSESTDNEFVKIGEKLILVQ